MLSLSKSHSVDYPNVPSKASVTRTTYDCLRKDIVLGNLTKDSKLKLFALSNQYSVSMLTLRNVLHRLSSEGFVVLEEQRGFFVAPLTKHNLVEVADLRYLLESHMLELSFARGDLQWESKMQSAYHLLHTKEQMSLSRARGKADDGAEMFELKLIDYDFHCALISQCNSQELLSCHKIAFDKYMRYLLHGKGFRGKDAMLEHKNFLDCALRRDAKRAKHILKKHIYECVEKLGGENSNLA